MSQNVASLDLSFIASEDLNGTPYVLVIFTGTGTPRGVSKARAADYTESCVGILQNKPKAGETAVVRVAGTSKLYVEEAVEAGTPVGVGVGAGYGRVADTDLDFVIGYSLEPASAANDIIEVLIDKTMGAQF